MPKLFIVRLSQKVLKLEFAIEAIIIFVKSIKRGIKWYFHFIGKSIIWTVIHLSKQVLRTNCNHKNYRNSSGLSLKISCSVATSITSIPSSLIFCPCPKHLRIEKMKFVERFVEVKRIWEVEHNSFFFEANYINSIKHNSQLLRLQQYNEDRWGLVYINYEHWRNFE